GGPAHTGRARPGRGRVSQGPQEFRGVREEDPGPLAGEEPGEEPPDRRAGTAGRRTGREAGERLL
ncbi:MAG: hypothetical protein AVDCRST_MAG12-3428, partial [uncultured Rubrobacteraceae bacterium]